MQHQHGPRARLITVSEAWNTGCQTWQNKTCPKYMYNYLKLAVQYEATVDGGEASHGYWTINCHSSNVGHAWVDFFTGDIENAAINANDYGARAVVEINR